jgi:hypothetical protein
MNEGKKFGTDLYQPTAFLASMFCRPKDRDLAAPIIFVYNSTI